MPLPHISTLNSQLLELRREYQGAASRQRFHVVLQRINNPAAYASELVTRVSAVEAYARSLLANEGAKSNNEVLKNYRKFAKREATGLIMQYLKLKGTTPLLEVGEELWETFRAAEKARNLIVHECTYLDAEKYLPMENACTEVLLRLNDSAKRRLAKSAA